MMCWVSKQVGLELPTAEDRGEWRAAKASWVLKPFGFTDKGAKILAMGGCQLPGQVLVASVPRRPHSNRRSLPVLRTHLPAR